MKCACNAVPTAIGNQAVGNSNDASDSARNPYILQSNAADSVRLESQARHLCATMNHKVVHAPVVNSQVRTILDVGCGTGFVTDTLGWQFPNALVYGLDLTPVPDVGRQRPGNVRYILGNVLDLDEEEESSLKIVLASQKIDFVFSRLLVCGMTDWPKYISTVYNLLEPGGWIELQDIDWEYWLKDSTGGERVISNPWIWFQRIRAAAVNHGLDPKCGSNAAARLKAAGFEGIQVHESYWPFGGEGEERAEMRALGEYVVDSFWRMGDGLLARMVGTHDEDFESMRTQMHKDLGSMRGKRIKFFVTVGRKPMSTG